MNESHKAHAQPRLVDVSKPLRPIRVAAIRQPIKTTAPIVIGSGESVRKPSAGR